MSKSFGTDSLADEKENQHRKKTDSDEIICILYIIQNFAISIEHMNKR